MYLWGFHSIFLGKLIYIEITKILKRPDTDAKQTLPHCHENLGIAHSGRERKQVYSGENKPTT